MITSNCEHKKHPEWIAACHLVSMKLLFPRSVHQVTVMYAILGRTSNTLEVMQRWHDEVKAALGMPSCCFHTKCRTPHLFNFAFYSYLMVRSTITRPVFTHWLQWAILPRQISNIGQWPVPIPTKPQVLIPTCYCEFWITTMPPCTARAKRVAVWLILIRLPGGACRSTHL